MRLRAQGVSEAQLARLRTPLGLDIGAVTPEEIAISVVAELVAVRRGPGPGAAAVEAAAVVRLLPGGGAAGGERA